MGFAGFNEESLAAMKEQGGIGDDTTKDTKDSLPDITLEDEKAKSKEGEVNTDLEVKTDLDPDKTDKDSQEDTKTKSEAESLDVAITEAGFKVEDLKDRIVKDGGMSDEFIAELKEKLDPELVDKYVQEFNSEVKSAKDKAVADSKAKNTAATEMNKFIYDSIGGEDKFDIMATVLNDSVDKADISKINAKLRSTNKDLVTEGLQDAVKAYNKATGRGEQRMEGDVQGGTKTDFIFLTKNAYQELITTDKYKTDRVYAKKVDDDRLKSKGMDSTSTLPGQYRNVRGGEMYNI